VSTFSTIWVTFCVAFFLLDSFSLILMAFPSTF
jgi:hypothetical protein